MWHAWQRSMCGRCRPTRPPDTAPSNGLRCAVASNTELSTTALRRGTPIASTSLEVKEEAETAEETAEAELGAGAKAEETAGATEEATEAAETEEAA